MEVTKENFEAVLPDVIKAIRSCSFVAFDCEFTGLTEGNVKHRCFPLDTPDERYTKTVEGSSRFAIMQLGICIFTKVTSKEMKMSYTASPYNFYMFPAFMSHKLDQRFMCQSSSLSFLATHNMDFNKWIKGGIPYLSEKDEKIIPVSEVTQILGLSKVIKAITAANTPLVGHNCLLDLIHMFKHFVGPLPDTLDAFKAELLKRFPCVYDTKTVAKHSAFEDCILSDTLTDLFEALHGMMFQGVVVDLPPSCSHYSSSQAHEAAYDAYMTGVSLLRMATHLASTNGRAPAETSVLEQLSVHMNRHISPSSPGICLPPPQAYFLSPPQAYLTLFQCIFPPSSPTHAHISHRISLPHNLADATSSLRVFLHESIDIPWLHLDSDEPERKGEHVVYMTFDERMTFDDIKDLFSPYGNAYITWIDNVSAFVSLQSKDKALEALSSMVDQGKSHTIPYNVYQASEHKTVEPNKIFVGGLGRKTTDETLKQYFSKFGEVSACIIKRDPITKQSKCYGFVTFTDQASVDEVMNHGVHKLDKQTIDPKPATMKSATRKV